MPPPRNLRSKAPIKMAHVAQWSRGAGLQKPEVEGATPSESGIQFQVSETYLAHVASERQIFLMLFSASPRGLRELLQTSLAVRACPFSIAQCPRGPMRRGIRLKTGELEVQVLPRPLSPYPGARASKGAKGRLRRIAKTRSSPRIAHQSRAADLGAGRAGLTQ